MIPASRSSFVPPRRCVRFRFCPEMPAGNHVREFYLQDMLIHGCLGCEGCSRAQKGTDNPCVQKDDMAEINKAFMSSDVVVFASPIYLWTISGPLKTAVDRLCAELRSLGYHGFPRKSVLLMTAGGNDYSQAIGNCYRRGASGRSWTSLADKYGRREDEVYKALLVNNARGAKAGEDQGAGIGL